MAVRVLVGDAVARLTELKSGSVDSCVTDPPYELSKDGKASPNRVFLEMMFPHQPQVVPASAGDVHLPRLIQQILRLRDGGPIPRPAPAVPVGAVALDGDVSGRQVEIEDGGEGAIGASDGQGWHDGDTEASEHFGDFTLELTDAAALLNALDRIGCSFLAGGLGIGLRIGPSTLPSLLAERDIVDLCDANVRARYYATADLVRALSGATVEPVARLTLGRCALETLTTDGALVLCAVLLAGGAKLVRTETATGRLSAKLESRRVRIVEPTTHRALSLNLVLHPQIIASTGFMGKEWDGGKVAYDVAIWREVYQVLKPGAHVVAFGSPRTFHRLMCAIEDAGFELRDTLSWMFGSGFPKGKGQLKPAWEPIVLARKPGPSPWLNVDGCRISAGDGVPKFVQKSQMHVNAYGDGLHGSQRTGEIDTATGRWPANVVLDEEAAALLDEQSGELTSGTFNGNRTADKFRTTYGAFAGARSERGYQSNSGGASRFFYCAKASPSERRPYNDHPTVKPLALMEWLVRLVTPTGGTVLDPFCGSGSTLIAADREGLDAIGIDNDPYAVEIATRRLHEDGGMFADVRVEAS